MTIRTALRNSILASLTLSLLSIAAVAQQKVLTPELIVSIRGISNVQLSPDGKQIVFQVSQHREESERPGAALQEVWMMSTSGGEPYRFTYNEKSDRSPQWSPDGKWIAFLSQRGNDRFAQVYVISSAGGEARRLTNADSTVNAFKWSPDGRKMAYTAIEGRTEEERKAIREGRDWIIADQHLKHTRLYVIDVQSRESHLVTPHALTVHDFDWSPDGRFFILGAAETPLVDDSYMRQQLLVVPARGGEPSLLIRTEGKLTHPRWSPDGKWIAWLGATEWKDPFAGSVFVVPVEVSGERVHARGIAENLLTRYEGTATWLDWQAGKPSTIVFAAIERQATALHTIALPDKKRTPLQTQDIVFTFGSSGWGPSFSKDGRLMAIAAHRPSHPNEVFFGEASNKPLKRLTNFNPQLEGVALGSQEVVKWKSTDGREMEGVLVKPVGYRRGQRYPVVLQAHGGPESADVNGWLGSFSRWAQMLAGRNIATFYPNYRGSVGRGVEFSMANQRDLMGKEFEDMVSGIDYLIEQGIADPNRIGIGGGSYGGYTAAWGATAGSDRFKAAVMWMGISNWISMTGTSDIFWENSTVHWDAIMYEGNNYELYWERSPLAHIQKANTPTLIVHGQVDPRVPLGQSQEMYTALKWKGVPVEFVTYPRAGHTVAERAHQLDFMNRVAGWFEKYLKDGITEK